MRDVGTAEHRPRDGGPTPAPEVAQVIRLPAGNAPHSDGPVGALRNGSGRHDPLLRDLQGEVLRATRHERGLTLAEVAARSSVSLAYLSEIERGRKEASSEILAGVCGALDLTLADFLFGCARLQSRQVPELGSRRLTGAPQPGGVTLMLAA